MRCGRIQLRLQVDDIAIALPQLTRKADAWFLDGFAPAKNADMWSAEVLAEIARLSQLHTTFATFTSAGLVRRGCFIRSISSRTKAAAQACGQLLSYLLALSLLALG
jgi:tRNA 5-methylaminomethyl-2-thiouridine biosynthesis bifunctional protein